MYSRNVESLQAPASIIWLVVALVVAGLGLEARAQHADGSFSLNIVVESGAEIAISPERYAKLARRSVTGDDRDGSRHSWEGPLLGDLLQEAGVPLGKELRGERLLLCLIVEAADGYRAMFSLAELDPSNIDTSIILADRRDGSVMDDREGPLRVIAPNEKRRARWVRQVKRLVIVSAPELKP